VSPRALSVAVSELHPFAEPRGRPVSPRTSLGTPIYAQHAAARRSNASLLSTVSSLVFHSSDDSDSDDDGGTPIHSEFHLYPRDASVDAPAVVLHPRAASVLALRRDTPSPSLSPPRGSLDTDDDDYGTGDIAPAPRWPLHPNAAWPEGASCAVLVLRTEAERKRARVVGEDEWVSLGVPDVLSALRELRVSPVKAKK
jgi:hypothetical protein